MKELGKWKEKEKTVGYLKFVNKNLENWKLNETLCIFEIVDMFFRVTKYVYVKTKKH